MSSERLEEIGSPDWNLSGGVRFRPFYGQGPCVSFGPAGLNANGARAETNFTAVSGEPYTVSFLLFSHDAGSGGLFKPHPSASHRLRVEVIDEDTGQVIRTYNTSIRDGTQRNHSFTFDGPHSGNLSLRFTCTGSSGATANSDMVVFNPSVTGLDPDVPVPCLTAGTLVTTPDGPVPVEQLTEGQLVTTLDHGDQPIRWIGTFTCAGIGKMAPIRIPEGLLDNRRELLVSPQHRLLVSSPIAMRMFGVDDLLIPAVKLLGHGGVARVERGVVTYVHLLFDRHEIVFAEGAATESLLMGTQAVVSLKLHGALDGLFEASPDAVAECGPNSAPARRIVESGRLARQFLHRHDKNGRPLVPPKVSAA